MSKHHVGLRLRRDSQSRQAAGWLQPCALATLPACCACSTGWGRGWGSSEHSPVALDLRWKKECASLARKMLRPRLGCRRRAWLPVAQLLLACRASAELLARGLLRFSLVLPLHTGSETTQSQDNWLSIDSRVHPKMLFPFPCRAWCSSPATYASLQQTGTVSAGVLETGRAVDSTSGLLCRLVPSVAHYSSEA